MYNLAIKNTNQKIQVNIKIDVSNHDNMKIKKAHNATSHYYDIIIYIKKMRYYKKYYYHSGLQIEGKSS